MFPDFEVGSASAAGGDMVVGGGSKESAMSALKVDEQLLHDHEYHAQSPNPMMYYYDDHLRYIANSPRDSHNNLRVSKQSRMDNTNVTARASKTRVLITGYRDKMSKKTYLILLKRCCII